MPASNTFNTIFYNSDYIVIEYMDMIKSPYLLLLSVIRKNEKIKEILKIEQIEFLDDAALYEWYINRKHQNFFIDLNRYPDEITEEQLNDLLEDQMNITPQLYQKAIPLILTDMLKVVSKKKVTKGVIVYHPHKNIFARNDLGELIPNNSFTFMSNWDDVMAKAGANSTYFLSDINKILLMKEKGVLRCSSITLPVEYRYNKKNMTDMKLDFEKMVKEDPFKISFCNSCSILKKPTDYDEELKEYIGGNYNGISE